MAWKQNIIEDFKQLVSFDSISFHERQELLTVATPEIFLLS